MGDTKGRLREPTDRPVPHLMAPMPDTRHPSILVVDEEDLIRWSLGQVLTRKGYAVVLAETGEAGLALFLEHAPDLVLLDRGHSPRSRHSS